jgi:hypothetical protein
VVVEKYHRKLVRAVRNILEILQGCNSFQQYIRTVRSLTSIARRPAVLEACENHLRGEIWGNLGE